MSSLTKTTGIKQIMAKARKANTRITKNAVRGLKMGGVFLLRKSQEIVPVQFGTLKASGFTRNIGDEGSGADIVVGYGADVDYAVFVHEDLTKAHGREFNIKYQKQITAANVAGKDTVKGGMFRRGENQQAKFLEQPAREYRKQIIKIVAREASK